MWNIEELTGYKPITTFWSDFTIAELYGAAAIKETYMRVMEEWKDDYKFMTELSLVVNWKSWFHAEKGLPHIAELYTELYYQHDEWFYDYFHGQQEILDYYWKITD